MILSRSPSNANLAIAIAFKTDTRIAFPTSSNEISNPTLPEYLSSPLTVGSWPEICRVLLIIMDGLYKPTGLAGSGNCICMLFKRSSTLMV